MTHIKIIKNVILQDKNRHTPYHFVIVCENTFFDKTKAAF